MILIIVFGVIGFILSLLVYGYIKDKNMIKKLSQESQARQKKYGDPKYGLAFDPVHVLKSLIPQAPFGYLWEIKIVKDKDNGDYGLSLGIFNLQKEIIEDSRVMNISKFNNDPTNKNEYMSVEHYYVKAGLGRNEIDQRSDTLIAHFTGPLLAWSKTQHPVIEAQAEEELDLELTAGGFDAVKKLV